MTVEQLIKKLQAHDPKRIVVMSIDEEGNGFTLLRDLGTSAYKDGEIGLESLTQKDINAGFSEEDILKGKPALVLWP